MSLTAVSHSPSIFTAISPNGAEYAVKEQIGKGVYGTVFRASCTSDPRQTCFAVKISPKTTNNNENKLFRFIQEREEQIIWFLNARDFETNPIVVRLKEGFNLGDQRCTVFELLSINLRDQLRMGNLEGFSISQTQKIAIQLFSALDFFRQNNLVHADLKPENIVFTALGKIRIRIIDFGLSFFLGENHYKPLQTLAYRAPEVVEDLPITPAIDMWGAGCILSEVYTGKILFFPKIDNLLSLIKSFLAKPIQFCKAASPEDCVREATFADLLGRILTFDQEVRILPQDALEHPFTTTTTTSFVPLLTMESDVVLPTPTVLEAEVDRASVKRKAEGPTDGEQAAKREKHAS